jgi:PKD repeat protein
MVPQTPHSPITNYNSMINILSTITHHIRFASHRLLFFILLHLCIVPQAMSQTYGNWQLLGPIDFPTNITGQIHGIGRVCQLKFHPSLDSVLFAPSASGGLFKSVDRGVNWTVLGTDVLPNTACASVCIDHTNDSVLYLGTGDPNYYGNGEGIWKSVDAGLTWSPSNNGIGNLLAVEILMDPVDPQILIAATKSGIWKTYDGGQNWVEKNTGGEYTDMAYKAVAGTHTLYAATRQQFWMSLDLGETWTQITIPFPTNGGPNGIRIGTTPADTNVVYLGVIFFEPGNHYGTVYRSDDGGLTFAGVKTQPTPDIAGYDATSPGQGNYNWTLCVDPLNEDKVYTGSHCVWRSDDGGVNWTKLTDWWAEVHTDMHHFVFNPYNSQELWQVNDGGVWLSVNEGVNWVTRCDGLAATENYHIAQSPIRKDMISAGTQDNGETFFQNDTWYCNRGGDWGTRMIFDYYDATRVYYYESGKRRHVTTSEQDLTLPFTPSNNMRLAFTPLNTSLAFASFQGVWRTDDLNDNPPAWTPVLPLTSTVKAMTVAAKRTDQLYVVASNATIYRSDNVLSATPTFVSYPLPAGTSVSANITTIAADSMVVYVSCGTKVYRSDDQGATWTNVTFNLPNVNIVSLIHDSSFATESVYAASAVGVWYRNDTMSYWLNYSQGLPTIAEIKDLTMYSNGSVSNSLRVGYYGRGTWASEPYGGNTLPPDPLFVADTTYGCAGLAVQFTDQSAGNPTSWSWNFPGGTPSTSNVQNPQVVYNVPGIYDVTLTVANTNGSKSNTRLGYIAILGSTPLPLLEDFQQLPFPSPGWIQHSATNDGAWQRNTVVGGYALSAGCAFFDNYNADLTGKTYSLRTPTYDLTTTDSAFMFFDVAYAQYNNLYSDTLIVSASTDCGLTWTTLYVKGGFELATSGNVTATAFVPAGFQWRTDTVWLDAYSGMPQVQLALSNKNGYGQMLYIDNINVFHSNGTSVPQVASLLGFSLYPNPSSGEVNLSFQITQPVQLSVRIYDESGKLVHTEPEKDFTTGSHLLKLQLSHLPAGNYSVECAGPNSSFKSRLQILRN